MAAKRVIRDPQVNQSIGKLLLGAAEAFKEKAANDRTAGDTQDALMDDITQNALMSLAKAVAGRDAVQAEGEPCRGGVRVFFAFLDANIADQDLLATIKAFKDKLEDGWPNTGIQRYGKAQLVSQDILKTIPFQLLDNQLKIVGGASRTFDARGGLLISQVEVGTAYLSFPSNLFKGADILDYFLATDPGADTFKPYKRHKPSVGCPLTVNCPIIVLDKNEPTYPLVTGGTPPYTLHTAHPGFTFHDNGTITITNISTLFGATGHQGLPVIVTDWRGQRVEKQCKVQTGSTKDLDIIGRIASPIFSKSKSPASLPGFAFRVGAGLDTRVIVFIRRRAAQVRCFSLMEGDDCCGKGKQYVSRVAISARQGDELVECRPTGESGCSGFRLKPGMYTFSAPNEITIEGCNYMLASSSPIAAYLGAGQTCSDIYFSYKKKGSDLQVISEIDSALGGDPYKTASLNFPGMQYLLLREGDQTFAQQKTSAADGGPVYFRNLTPGTYWLFCQAPSKPDSPVVTPVYPPGGWLSLRVFAGQTAAVPIRVKFRTTTTKPAKLDGYVRDATGQPNPQQVVQVLDNTNSVVAAGLTDGNGYYSIQIYSADDLTIRVGTQQIAVSKSDIQTAMLAVGTPALPSPGATLDLAVQTSELVREF